MSDYAIIRADGYYRDTTDVVEVYDSEELALAATRRGWQAIRMTDAEVGRTVHQIDLDRGIHRRLG